MSTRLRPATKRIKCVSCTNEFVTHTTNYCTVCLHNGELSRLGHPFFQRDGGFPPRMEMATPVEQQTGIETWM